MGIVCATELKSNENTFSRICILERLGCFFWLLDRGAHCWEFFLVFPMILEGSWEVPNWLPSGPGMPLLNISLFATSNKINLYWVLCPCCCWLLPSMGNGSYSVLAYGDESGTHQSSSKICGLEESPPKQGIFSALIQGNFIFSFLTMAAKSHFQIR